MEAIDNIADAYKSRYQWHSKDVTAGFSGLYKKYVKERKQDILDSAAVGVALESLLEGNKLDIDAMPDNVKEAFNEAFPNLSIESLNDRGPAELAGLINAWKGKLFEVEVRDQLNDGVQVGNWQLDPGQHAELAQSATQRGWDLSIVNDDGSVADVIQLKATESASYVHHALERYPEVPIISTSDVSGHSDVLSAAQLSDHDVTSQVHDVIDDGDSVSDALLNTLPGSVIAATEIYQVIKGKKTVDQAMASGGQRAAMSVASGVVGAAATALLGPVGWFAGMGFRLWLGNKVRQQTSPEFVIVPEKEINPRPKLPRPKKTATKEEAKQAFVELARITERLLLEYKGA